MRAPAPAALLVVAACAGQAVTLPGSTATAPTGVGELRAGFGRANITPDIRAHRVGLGGYGPDGRLARGVRDSLWARALVVEDRSGERVALVTVDLPMSSIRIHRMVAAAVAPTTLIGPDRLIIAATHTHAGPGGIADAAYYNTFGSAVVGSNEPVVAALIDSIAAAVRRASDDLAPAKLAWGAVPVWGVTWNRSYAAFARNPTRGPFWDSAPAGLGDSARAVDPTWLLLRVDQRDTATGMFRPAGAFSVFAMHGTFVPNVNDQIDPDIFGDLAASLERRIGERAGGRAVAGIANGTEGDVTAAWPAASRCPPPRLLPGPRAPGPRAPPPPPAFRDVGAAQRRHCIAIALEASEALAERIADRVMRLYDDLVPTADMALARSFRVVPLRGGAAPPELCDEPMVGVAQPGGSSEDGRSRLFGWRALHLLWQPLREGGASARPSAEGCQGRKRSVAAPLQVLLGRMGGAPDLAQVSLLRLGDVVLAGVPAEVTTQAGEQMREAIRSGLGPAAGVRHVGVVSLVNGYMQYVTTAAEYEAQHYEGASNLYGPLTAAMFARVLREMSVAGFGAAVAAGPVRVWP